MKVKLMKLLPSGFSFIICSNRTTNAEFCIVVGLMKMGNIAHIVGVEPTLLAFYFTT